MEQLLEESSQMNSFLQVFVLSVCWTDSLYFQSHPGSSGTKSPSKLHHFYSVGMLPPPPPPPVARPVAILRTSDGTTMASSSPSSTTLSKYSCPSHTTHLLTVTPPLPFSRAWGLIWGTCSKLWKKEGIFKGFSFLLLSCRIFHAQRGRGDYFVVSLGVSFSTWQ